MFPRIVPALLLLSLLPAAASAQCQGPGNCVFPPGSCAYVSFSPATTYSSGDALLLFDFEASLDCLPVPPPGPPQVQVVRAAAVTRYTPFGGSTATVAGPAMLTLWVTGGAPGNPQPFTLELVALDLSALSFGSGVRVRESPTLASSGGGQIQDLGGGQFRIDSFFDVFTELSLDGGQSWYPGNQPQRMLISQGPPLPARPATWGSLKAAYR